MREKILHTASELFLNLGVRSVTMDDIAEKMAISKKTIYEHYNNKTELIKASTHFVFDQINNKISSICKDKEKISPIQALFDIDKIVLECIDEDNTVEFQLRKYYPDIYQSLDEKKLKLVTESVTENLEHGIALGLYRADLNKSIIAKLYYTSTIALKNSELFSPKRFKMSEIMKTYLTYHVRAIATPKGIKELETILQNEL